MPNNYKRYLDNWYYTGLWNLMQKYIYSWDIKMWWLVKRRIEESNLIF